MADNSNICKAVWLSCTVAWLNVYPSNEYSIKTNVQTIWKIDNSFFSLHTTIHTHDIHTTYLCDSVSMFTTKMKTVICILKFLLLFILLNMKFTADRAHYSPMQRWRWLRTTQPANPVHTHTHREHTVPVHQFDVSIDYSRCHNECTVLVVTANVGNDAYGNVT